MSDTATPVTPDPVEAPGATVSVVESEHDDAVTLAWDKVDVYADKASISDDEIDRMQAKLERAQADAAAAQDCVDEAVKAKTTRAAELDAVTAELDAVKAANPGLAAEVEARREAAKTAKVADLKAQLARLTKDN